MNMLSALLIALQPASAQPALGQPTLAQPALAQPDRATAARIAAMINDYRAANRLRPIPYSPSLRAVAEAHVLDMAASEDGGRSFIRGRDSRGLPCNAHSWSGRGPWTPVCYTDDHRHAARLWSKPSEITRGAYPGYGFEIGHQTGGTVTAEGAVSGWQSSPAHNAVILERGIWRGKNWQAMGVGVLGHSAFIWFGRERDAAR